MKLKHLSFFLIAFLLMLFSCKDTTAPLLMLKGDLVMYHVLNQPFTDPGYVAIDDKDGDLTDKVQVTPLNVDSAGVHLIKYSVADQEGNIAEAVRTVIVYNEASKYLEGVWEGEYVYPYPGIDKVSYIDSIAGSVTENNVIIIHNFAGNIGADVKGTLIMSGVLNAPVIRFEDQQVNGQNFSAQDAPVEDNFTKITVQYTLGGNDGVLVLAKQ